MDSLALALMLWIGNNSPYPTSGMHAPSIIELTPTALTREAYTDHPDKIPEGGIDDRIYALYAFEDGPNGTIYILQAKLADGAEDYPNPIDNCQDLCDHRLYNHAKLQQARQVLRSLIQERSGQ